MSRHASQLKVLADIEALKRAIESLPPDADASLGHVILFLDRDHFVEKFRGFDRVRRGYDGCLFVEWDGVRWASTDPTTLVSEYVKL